MKIIIIITLAVIMLSFSIDKPAYVIFDKNGIKSDYQVMMDSLKGADIVLFGEFHDNPIAHWLQYEVTKQLYFYKQYNLVLGAEMFEVDNQDGLNRYLKGEIDDEKLAEEVRLWPNYNTDYKPLVDFAKEYKLKFIATNIPRVLANNVFKEGFESLDKLKKEEKAWVAPLPINYESGLKCYQKMLSMDMHGMANENLPKAQAAKDATMAHFIIQNWEQGKLFIHYNGAFHSDFYEGIVWYLKMKNKDLKIVTVSTVTQNETNKLEEENIYKADFIICVPESMTRTH